MVVLLVVVLLVGGLGLLWWLDRDGAGPADGAASGDGAAATTGAEESDGAGASGGGSPVEGPPSCEAVTVWSAPELLPAVESAADRAAEGSADCFTYAVVSRDTAVFQASLRDGEEPDVWLPSSLAWAQLVEQSGTDLDVGQTVATSPVLLTGRPEVVAGLADLGVGPDSTFAEVLQQYQESVASGGPEVSLRLGDPRTDPASMALLGSTSDQLGGLSEPGSPGRNLLVLLAQSSIQGDPLAAVRSDPTTLVPATEQQLGRAVADGEELRGVALQGGVGTVTMPFVRVGDAGSAEAVDALEEQLLSEDGAADLLALDLRPGADGEAPGVPGIPEDLALQAAAPDAEVSARLARTWAVIAPQSRILTLIDISGSMEAVVGEGTTRIDLTREAAQTALAVVPGQTAIGLWYFATALDDDTDFVEVVPLRPLNEEVRSGVTHEDVLLAETEDLGLDTLQGDTGLHDALWAAYQFMQEDYRPDAISSVLLLTDGINDDSTGGLSEDEVVERLEEARAPGDRPVTVVLIGMGPDVDADALERLAAAAGGESLVLRDPRELPQVFVDVVARRAG
ncbi:hypothetical protein GCM10011509_01640 [Ornithinimicrobium pekingense]|uniref:VWFA domain-containing protein n=2 Tax=Ornithinimicrobium pekingense TaxID=384677 RepID=A0ABQ2F5X3_9MICO|nr:hypothetical protein GCM10011509_01640 [Ornithinimicrobium pekingense]